MKHILRKICVILFAGATVFAAAGLAACTEKVSLESLSIVDPRTVFLIGDEFEYGESFKVYANYTDGTRTDVTDQAEIRKESGFDMNVPGDYQLTVIYETKREVYTIFVNDFDAPLRKLELNTTNVKTQFELGDTATLDGIVITSTYENAQGNLITSTSSSLRGLTVGIDDGKGNLLQIGDVFVSLGEYTVTVSSGSVKASYTVSVEGINISTVRGALAVGNFFQSEVSGGTQKVRGARKGESLYDSFDYEYVFGDRYTRVYEKIDTDEVNHYGIDAEGIFCTTTQNGDIVVSSGTLRDEMMNGAPVFLWYYGITEYGIEATLGNLYDEALKCTNHDLKEQANEETRQYAFSFSGLIFRSNDSNYFETAVSFTLGENYNIEHVLFTQSFWENNSNTHYDPTFKTDENGITTPLTQPTHRMEVTTDQTVGERTAVNPYNREMFKIQDYNLLYRGNAIESGDTVSGDMNNNMLTITIEGITPATADIKQDPMYLSLLDGNSEVDSTTMLLENGIMAWRRNNVLYVQFDHGGKYTLVLRTQNTRKTIVFDIVGVPPKNMTAQIYNEAAQLFAPQNSKTVALNSSVYFLGAVDQYANPAQTAEITSDNVADASIQKTKINGIDCFEFKASREGTYTVRIVSDVASGCACTLTFTVSDVPDYEGLLRGNYTVMDRQENIFALAFTPASGVSGKVTVTKTPTDETDGAPITDEAVTAVYSYVVDVDRLEITLTLDSGTELGVGLTVDATGDLVLIDQYGDRYVLVAAN